MVLFSSDDELSGERKCTKRRANTISLKNLAIGGSDEDEAPGFARPTLALSTKSKKGTKRFDNILSELSDLSSDEQPRNVWQKSRTLGAIPTPTLAVESHGGHGVLDKAGMDELRAMKSSISEVPLFQNCSPKFVEAIAEQVSHRLFTPGVDIMTEGEYGDSMYILHRGDVEVIIGGTTVCTLSDGAVFGEIAALCKNPLLARRTATIRALTLCDCRVTYRDSLLKVMSRFKGDEDIVSRKLETRIVELRKMGKLPNQKEWWRVSVKQQEGGPAPKPRSRPTLPSLGDAGEKGSARADVTPALDIIADNEDQRTASNTPDESRGRGEKLPVWALEMACRRTDGLGVAFDRSKMESVEEEHGRRQSVPGQPVMHATGGRQKKVRGPRGHSCISSVASMKADAHDRECAENELFEWPQSARLPRRTSGAPLAPPALPTPPVPRVWGARTARSAPHPVAAMRGPSPLRILRDIRSSR